MTQSSYNRMKRLVQTWALSAISTRCPKAWKAYMEIRRDEYAASLDWATIRAKEELWGVR